MTLPIFIAYPPLLNHFPLLTLGRGILFTTLQVEGTCSCLGFKERACLTAQKVEGKFLPIWQLLNARREPYWTGREAGATL
jgi:hypothetical protein